MEKVLTTNNCESNWDKLAVFGLHSRGSKIGFNSYHGFNGAVLKVDVLTGMRIMFYPAKAPKSERTSRTITLKTPGKRGRPAIFSHPKQAHEPGIRGRKPMQGPAELLIFSGPKQKRGPKAQTPEQKLVKAILNGAELKEPAKRGRLNEAQRIAAAKPGDIVKANGGGSWLILPQGIPTFMP